MKLDDTYTGLVASVAIQTGIGPNDLLDAPAEVFAAIVELLRQRARAVEKARNKL